jgi:large subunit ribosomal protein L5
MKGIHIAKVTLNIGVGEGGEKLANAKTLIERVSGRKAIIMKAQTRIPSFKIRKGDPLGVKVTIRGKPGEEIVKKALESRDSLIPLRSIDRHGNLAFGVAEYIDFPGVKYDPKIGMLGFDVCVTIEKPGTRIARRRIRQKTLPAKQRPKKAETRAYLEKEFGVKFQEEVQE